MIILTQFGYYNSCLFQVTGVVFNKDNEIKWVLNGSWDAKMEISKVVSSTQKTKGSKPVIETGTPKLIWKRTIPPYVKL